MAFQTKVTKARFVGSGYTGAQMASAANGLISRGIVPRIRSGMGVNDSAAPPLKPRYLLQKQRKHPPAIRNWEYTGRTLRSMKVITAAQNRAVIQFSDSESNKRAAINNRRFRQFGVSHSDQRVLAQEYAKLPPHTRAAAV